MLSNQSAEMSPTPLASAPPPWSGSRGGPLDAMETEAIAINLQAAAQIHKNHQFFSWTQGLLQSLINHEMLICIATNGENALARVESFSTTTLDQEFVRQLCRQDTALIQSLIQQWRGNHQEPGVHHMASEAQFASSALARELQRVGAGTILCLGAFGADSRLAAFYIFACSEEALDLRRTYIAELLLPFLHAAWVRTRVEPVQDTSPRLPQDRSQLTQREQEVLKWIYLGKSNIEIGLILGISPLTVKNHVQEILRRLNVLNRAQAVGKALSLHLISTN